MEFDIEYLSYKANQLNLFRQYQKICWDTLIIVHKICEDHGIRYSLAYGSLLGAIRHNGSIPWDYDIDIWVDFTQKDKFIEALKRDLPENIKFFTRFYNKNCRHFIMRITPDGYDPEALHVDVFWMHRGLDSEKKINRINRKFEIHRNLAFWKTIDIKYVCSGSKLSKLFHKAYKYLYKLIPMWILDKYYQKLCNSFDNSSPFLSDEFMMFDSSDFNNLILHKMVDESTLRIPANYEKVLTQIYGNWRDYAPIENRVQEMESSLIRLKKFGKR